jgi:hypothetical protein
MEDSKEFVRDNIIAGEGADCTSALASCSPAFMDDERVNAFVGAGFAQWTTEGTQLLDWASRVSAVSNHQEYPFLQEQPDFCEQVRTQLRGCLQRTHDQIPPGDATGDDRRSCEALVDIEKQELLCKYIEALVQLYSSADPDSSAQDDLTWYLFISINAPGACTKFHDDNLMLRCVSTLHGDGTVIGHNDSVKWQSYRKGIFNDVVEDPEKLEAWNQHVVGRERSTSVGDVVLMKGGKACPSHPCLHRAPYSASPVEPADSRRLLITLERIPANAGKEKLIAESVISPSVLKNTMLDWLQELRGAHHKPETEEHGISSFVYRAELPFSPRRLDRMLSNGFKGVLRSKGIVWIASHHDHAVEWAQASSSMNLEQGPKWLKASVPEHEWPEELQVYKDHAFGDRRQEVVFIGAGMNERKIRAALDKALLNEREMKVGPKVWKRWPPVVEAKEEQESRKRKLEEANLDEAKPDEVK